MTSFTKNVFNEVRQLGDVDLVEQITDMMTEANHPDPLSWHHNDTIDQAKVAAPKLQRFLINRYWRMRLGTVQRSTVAERFCLIDEGSMDEYLKVFKTGVLPTIVELGL